MTWRSKLSKITNEAQVDPLATQQATVTARRQAGAAVIAFVAFACDFAAEATAEAAKKSSGTWVAASLGIVMFLLALAAGVRLFQTRPPRVGVRPLTRRAAVLNVIAFCFFGAMSIALTVVGYRRGILGVVIPACAASAGFLTLAIVNIRVIGVLSARGAST